MKSKVYIAGPLFTEGERILRHSEGANLTVYGIPVYNPIQEFNVSQHVIPRDLALHIFNMDFKGIMSCTHFIFDISNNDPGTILELGIVLSLIEVGKIKRENVVVTLSDSRAWISQKKVLNVESGFGINQFLLGALKYYDIEIVRESVEAIEYIQKLILK